MNKPSTPIVVIILALYLFTRAVCNLILFILPYIKTLAIACYSLVKVLLKQSFVAIATWAEQVRYYCYPSDNEGFLDTFLGVGLSDLGRAIAAFARLGGRIFE